jgi:hypothetical protein
MQLLKISNIICFFILPVDVVVKPVLAESEGQQVKNHSKQKTYL